jgi:hypothetical protein
MGATSVMTLLNHHVPLSLLCDLLDPDGPASAEILAVESGRADLIGARGSLLESASPR